jgi:hypothetical protein
MLILGLDVSNTTIGIALLEIQDNKIYYIDSSFYKPPKDENLFDRLYKTKQDISKIIEEYSPDVIVIEDLIQFMAGRSSAKTIISLGVMNRMIGLLSYEYLKEPPKLLSVLQIRHGIRRMAGLTDLPAKEELPDLMDKLLKINLPRYTNKKGKLKMETYDECDAVCVAYYCALQISGLDIKKSKKNKNVK